MREHYVTIEEEGGGELYNRKGGSPVEFIEFTGGDWHPAHPPKCLFLSQPWLIWIIYLL